MTEIAETQAQALARLYDVDLLEDPGDPDLYLALAARTRGPVLELGAGTGRVTAVLAAAGHDVTAVDSDPAMLARLRRRLEGPVAGGTPEARSAGDGEGDGESGAAKRGEVSVEVGDMTALELAGGARFRLAIVPLNTFLMLGSRQAQRAAIETMARYLLPEGMAVVDVALPSAQELARYDGRIGLEYVRTDPETALVVTKTVAAEYEPASGTVQVRAFFDEGEPGAPPRRWIRHDVLRLVGAEELRDMALAAGFQVEMLAGTYALDPLEAHDDRVILVARRHTRVPPGSLL